MIEVRAARIDDADAMLDYVQRNRAFLAPFEPVRPDSAFTRDAMLERLAVTEQRVPYLALQGGRIVGQATIANISRGAFQSATLGYSVDEQLAGQGIASRMVRHVVRAAFDEHHLHRLEAGTLLDNVASQRVLEKCGFHRIGISPRHVKIAGRWQDHVLFAITAEELDRVNED